MTILPVPELPAPAGGRLPVVDYLAVARSERARRSTHRRGPRHWPASVPTPTPSSRKPSQAWPPPGRYWSTRWIPSQCRSRPGAADTLPVLEWELKAGLADYFARTSRPTDRTITTLADVIAFNDAHADDEMPWFDQAIFLNAEQRTGLDDPEYINAVLRIQARRPRQRDRCRTPGHDLDALVAPTNGPATRIDLVNGDHWLGGTSTLAAIAGYPLVTLPAGYRHGLPVGITFMGTAFSEATLIRLAYAFEQSACCLAGTDLCPAGVLPPGA